MNELNRAHLSLIESTMFSYEKMCASAKKPKHELDRLEAIILEQIEVASKHNPLWSVPSDFCPSIKSIKDFTKTYGDIPSEACQRYFLKHRFGK